MGVKTDTRRRMIESAALLVRERGVSGTSIAKVLEHSGGPRGSVGFHFPGGRAELLTEALQWAGGFVTDTLRKAADRGISGDRVFALVCDHYKRQLAATDYVGGCPIGAAAQEAFADPKLGPVVASTVDAWTGALADVLIRSGHDEDEAANLAMLCISALEGAITMSRVTRSTAPIDTVLARIAPMLVVRRP